MSKPIQNIILTGFMGTGKTSSGLILAGKTGRKFVDTDELIEKSAGMSVRDIFEKKGEKAFRILESKVIAAVSRGKGLVIATGGGAVTSVVNVRNLRRAGKVFALVSHEKDILKRVLREGKKRPLVNASTKAAALKKIRKLLKERTPLYTTHSDFVIDTTGLTPGTTAKKILGIVSVYN